MRKGIRKYTDECLLLTIHLFMGFLLTTTPVHAMDYWKKKAISSLLEQKMQLEGTPGATIALVQKGALIWSSGYGMSDVEHSVEASSQSVFRTASLVKPITATAILQLVASGNLDLDSPVTQYCPDYPTKKWPVTTRQLLSHVSGVRSYNMPWNIYEAELHSTTKYESITDALSIFKNDPLKFQPGTNHKYTSYGYNILGCVIENVSGLPYMKYLEENIFQVAGMTQTMAEDPLEVIPDRVSGYRRDKKGKLVNERYVDLSNKIPSGGLLTTASDMARFSISYMNGEFLPNHLQSAAMTPAKLNNGDATNYGFGWQIDSATNGEKIIYHGGVAPGVSAIMTLFPERNDAIVVMMNHYIVNGREKLVNDIAEIMQSE